MTKRDVLVHCIDGRGHDWEPTRIMRDGLDREWETMSCQKCNTGSLKLIEEPDASMATFLDLLAENRE